jgi:hypothetical protein
MFTNILEEDTASTYIVEVYPEDGGRIFFQNIGKHIPGYTP